MVGFNTTGVNGVPAETEWYRGQPKTCGKQDWVFRPMIKAPIEYDAGFFFAPNKPIESCVCLAVAKAFTTLGYAVTTLYLSTR